MQHFIKKAAALALAMVMALSLASVAFAADFEDMPTDWSADAVQSAVTNGLLSGKDGLIAAADNLTRAEMATIITRAFNAEVEDDISFTDVKTDAWYKSAVAKAVHMGAMNGSGSNGFTPAASVTRQEVFVVLARVLKLADGSAEDLAAFSDADKTASWAAPAVAALVKAGYVSGSNGALNPTGNITRAEFAQVMYNIFHNAYLNEAATYEEVDGDNVIISIANVTLKGVEVKGDVVVADGVGDGDVFLEDVTIGGRLVVRGGGMNSIHVKGKTTVDNVVMAKVDGNVRVVVAEESTVGTVTVESGKASTDVRVEGAVEKLVVNDAASTVVLADATVASVEVAVDGATVSLAGKTTVAEMTVPEGVSKTTVNAEPGTEITKLETAGDVFINQEDVIKDCNDETKINPEQPEESADPSASTAPGTDDKAPEDVTGHVHQLAGWTAFDATRHQATCSVEGCGETVLQAHKWVLKTEAAGQAEGDGEEGDPEAPAPKTYWCDICHMVKPVQSTTTSGDITPPEEGESCGDADSDHTWEKDESGHTQLNCATTDGVEKYTCSECGAKKDVTTTHTGAHTFNGAESDVVQPTCATTGSKKVACSVCGTKSDAITIPATGKHTAKMEDGELVWAIDEATGKHYVKCATCETYKGLNAGVHSVREWTVTEANHTGTCTVCELEVTASHNLGAYQSDNNYHWKVCSVCGIVGKTAHTWGEADEDGNITCSVCSKKIAEADKHTHDQAPAADSNKWTVTKEPNCTDKGSKYYTCSCGEKVTVEIATVSTAHVWGNTTTATEADQANGIAVGDSIHTCSKCNKVEKVTAAGGGT